MKSAAILLFALMLTAHDIFAQTLSKKPSRNEVGSYNQANLLKVDIGAFLLRNVSLAAVCVSKGRCGIYFQQLKEMMRRFCV